MDGDVQPGVADGVARGGEASCVAELSEDRHRGQLTDDVMLHQRSAAGLAARVEPQGARDRRRLRVECVDHLKRDRDLLAGALRRRQALKPGTVLAGQQAVALRKAVVIED
jgi:hypothetical protein